MIKALSWERWQKRSMVCSPLFYCGMPCDQRRALLCFAADCALQVQIVESDSLQATNYVWRRDSSGPEFPIVEDMVGLLDVLGGGFVVPFHDLLMVQPIRLHTMLCLFTRSGFD